MMHHFVKFATYSALGLLVTACTATATGSLSPSAAPSQSPAASASPATTGPTGVSGSVTASKAAFVAFLTCIKSKTPGQAEDLDIRIRLLDAYTEATWPQFKPQADNQVKTIFAISGQGCGL